MNTMHAIQCDHWAPLVALSFTISVFGAYCALQWAAQIPHRSGWLLRGWVAGSAVAMGGGAIWSMHFIAMIACRLPVAVSYDVTLTLVSLVVAIVVTGIGLYTVGVRASSRERLFAGGLFTGLGVAAMHYTGMAAMRLPARATYRPALVIASILIAVVAATAALWIAFNMGGGLQRLVSSLVMGVAVCGMHYTGMAAVTFHPTGAAPLFPPSALKSEQLGFMVFGVTLFVLALLSLGSRVVERRAHAELERQVAERKADLAKANEALRGEVLERRRMDEALQESEVRYRGIVESALDAVVTIDGSGVITAWNVQAANIFGWSKEEAVGRSLAETIIPAQHREAHSRGLRHAVATGEGPVFNKRIEITALHRDGREFPVELAISNASSGEKAAFSAFIRDITGSKLAAEALEKQHAFLRQVIDINPNFVFAKNRDGRFTLVNQAVADAYGTTVEELVGKTDADFNPSPDEVRFFLETDRKVMDSLEDKLISEERFTDAKGNVRFLQTVKRPIIGVDGRAGQVLGVSTDITDRKTLEEQLRQSQKMEAVGTLAGGVAHDFNNLLTTILGYSTMLSDAIETGNPLRGHVEEIRKAGQRAATLTKQLLAFSRKQLVEPKVLDLNAIVAEMNNMIRRLVGEDIDLVTVTEPALGHIKADRGQVEQILMNLVVNARDAMPRGGKLTIESHNVDFKVPYARENFHVEPGRYVMLVVSDAGLGMDAQTRARIFEPFFTTKEKGSGTGLGLSTVYGIVKQSGGYVWVNSEPGSGASFQICLPRVVGKVDRADSEDRPRPRPGTETILLVEDEDAVRRLTKTTLGSQGYTVLEARNGEEAVRVATETDGAIDLVLTDGVMPGMPIQEMVAGLRAVLPDVRMLLMSGYTAETFVRRGILESDIPFVEKPFTSDTLLRKVREVLDSLPIEIQGP
jgi:two-component system, cell cycle sensor histidine kinase and response regulator CckA